jgi:hypothetical protein
MIAPIDLPLPRRLRRAVFRLSSAYKIALNPLPKDELDYVLEAKLAAKAGGTPAKEP